MSATYEEAIACVRRATAELVRVSEYLGRLERNAASEREKRDMDREGLKLLGVGRIPERAEAFAKIYRRSARSLCFDLIKSHFGVAVLSAEYSSASGVLYQNADIALSSPLAVDRGPKIQAGFLDRLDKDFRYYQALANVHFIAAQRFRHDLGPLESAAERKTLGPIYRKMSGDMAVRISNIEQIPIVLGGHMPTIVHGEASIALRHLDYIKEQLVGLREVYPQG